MDWQVSGSLQKIKQGRLATVSRNECLKSPHSCRSGGKSRRSASRPFETFIGACQSSIRKIDFLLKAFGLVERVLIPKVLDSGRHQLYTLEFEHILLDRCIVWPLSITYPNKIQCEFVTSLRLDQIARFPVLISPQPGICKVSNFQTLL